MNNTDRVGHSITASEPLAAAQKDFWAAIQTIIGLQNQAPPLQASPSTDSLPLSFPEERLWLQHHFQPFSASLNIPFLFRLRGHLNLPALENSLDTLCRRHLLLRTAYPSVMGKPTRTVFPPPVIRLLPQSLTHLAVPEREPFALSQALQLAQQPFDIAQAPLLRGALFQLDKTSFVLLLNFHHLILDGWSVGVLWGELSAVYAAFAADRPSPLPALTLQYADFAVWQRQCLQGQFRELLLQYWQQQLEGFAFEPLPASWPRPAVPTRRSACEKLIIPAEVTTTLKGLSRQQGVTLFVTLLAAFELLLHRYTGQERFAVCTPAANRNRKELKGMVGYFVNLLILRADLTGDPSIVSLLHRVRQSVSGAFAHQDLPFQQVVEALNLGRAPLTQVMFALQNFPQQALQLADLEVTPLVADNGTADFDLFLSIREVSSELQGELKYNTDVFDPAHIRQMLEHYQVVLQALALHPDRPLSSSLPSDLAPVLRVVSAPTPKGDASPTTRDQLQGKGQVDRNAVLIGYLQTQVANLLGCAVAEVVVHHPLSQMGLDSLKAIALQHQLISDLGIDLSLEKLVQGSTIDQLAPLLLDRIAFQELTPNDSAASHEDLEEIML